MNEYGVFGPLTIPRTRRGGIDDDKLKDFWQQVEEKFAQGLAKASGCYIFGTRAGKGAMPWYVGKATKTFLQECFTDRNLRKYDKVLVERKGTPILFFLARTVPIRLTHTPTTCSVSCRTAGKGSRCRNGDSIWQISDCAEVRTWV